MNHLHYKLLNEFAIRYPTLPNLLINSYLVQNSSLYAGKVPAIISDKHKLICIYNSKVACSSIKKSLFPLFNIDEKVHPHNDIYPIKPTWKLLTDKSYFTFTFVRNPWDRLVSFYRDKIEGIYSTGMVNFYRKHYGSRFYHGMTFDELARLICKIPDTVSDPHFRSQTRKLFHNGKFLPDFVGRFEYL